MSTMIKNTVTDPRTVLSCEVALVWDTERMSTRINDRGVNPCTNHPLVPEVKVPRSAEEPDVRMSIFLGRETGRIELVVWKMLFSERRCFESDTVRSGGNVNPS